MGTTLEPGGHLVLDGSPGGVRAAMQPAMILEPDLGFADPADLEAFNELPEIVLDHCITGPLTMGPNYRLSVRDSLIDGGSGPPEAAPAEVIGAADPSEFGPHMTLSGATFLGRVRVRSAEGRGGIFAHRLSVRDHQSGCLERCRFSGNDDRLPPNHACVSGTTVPLSFTSTIWGASGYGQLDRIRTDARILEDGPDADEMGAFGYQLNTHRLKYLSIRLREFTPVGVRTLITTVT